MRAAVTTSCSEALADDPAAAAGKEERDAALKELKDIEMSVRRLERLTGINGGIIQKA